MTYRTIDPFHCSTNSSVTEIKEDRKTTSSHFFFSFFYSSDSPRYHRTTFWNRIPTHSRNQPTDKEISSSTPSPIKVLRPRTTLKWRHRNVFTSKRHRTSSDNTGTRKESSANCQRISSWRCGATMTRTPTVTLKALNWTGSCESLSPAPILPKLVPR